MSHIGTSGLKTIASSDMHIRFRGGQAPRLLATPKAFGVANLGSS
jgi:hypothetical protein